VNPIDALCRRARPHFSPHLDGERLALGAWLAVKLHLAFCPMCGRTYASLRATRDALRALRDAEPSTQPSETSSRSTKPSDGEDR
jgi:predicted anti-sigma-YlaC factor YlaD